MTVYNGTITVGNFSGAVYGYAGSGNIVGLPAFGSVSLDPGAPTLDLFYWAPDGSAVGIFFLGNVPGSVTWNGQEYPLTYDSVNDVSGYGDVGLSGPYPTSGTVNFTYDDAATGATDTLSLEVHDVGLTPEALGAVAGYVMPVSTHDIALEPQEVALVDGSTATISLETCEISIAAEEVGLNAGYQVFMQSNLVAPIYEDVQFTTTTNDLPLETFTVQILVYADGMGLSRGYSLELEGEDVATESVDVAFVARSLSQRPRVRSFVI